MKSNFAHARELLEQAWLQLSGDDDTSKRSRQAIDLLLDAITTAEFSSPRPQAEIIPFKLSARSPRR